MVLTMFDVFKERRLVAEPGNQFLTLELHPSFRRLGQHTDQRLVLEPHVENTWAGDVLSLQPGVYAVRTLCQSEYVDVSGQGRYKPIMHLVEEMMATMFQMQKIKYSQKEREKADFNVWGYDFISSLNDHSLQQ